MFWKKGGYKKPTGRMISRRYTGGSGIFKMQPHFWQARKFKIYGLLTILAIIFLSYFIFWSNLLKINKLEVTGTKNLDPAEIESIIHNQMTKSRFLVFSQSNILFFDSKMASEEVKKALVVNDIQIKKRPLKKLKIEVTEKTAQVVWITDNHYYYLDPNGLVVKENLVANINLVEGEAQTNSNEATAADLAGEAMIDLSVLDQSLPLVYDLTNSPVTVGKNILNPKLIETILYLKNKLPKPDLNIKNFQIPEPQGNDVQVVTDHGFDVYFDSQDSLDQQLANLSLVLREKVKDKKINYIDLRFGSRVYIK